MARYKDDQILCQSSQNVRGSWLFLVEPQGPVWPRRLLPSSHPSAQHSWGWEHQLRPKEEPDEETLYPLGQNSLS